jgi:hypothetical protein
MAFTLKRIYKPYQPTACLCLRAAAMFRSLELMNRKMGCFEPSTRRVGILPDLSTRPIPANGLSRFETSSMQRLWPLLLGYPSPKRVRGSEKRSDTGILGHASVTRTARQREPQANSNETELSLTSLHRVMQTTRRFANVLCSTKYPGARETHGRGDFNYCPRILPPHALRHGLAYRLPSPDDDLRVPRTPYAGMTRWSGSKPEKSHGPCGN